MIRVAYVCADPGIPVFGCKGASIHVQEVVRALRGAGARVDLYAARKGGTPPPGLSDLRVTLIGELAGGSGSGAGPGLGSGRGRVSRPAPTGAIGSGSGIRIGAGNGIGNEEEDVAVARARHALSANRALHDALVDDGPFDLVYERYSLWGLAGMAYSHGAGRCVGVLEVNAPLIEEQARWRRLVLPRHAARVARFAFGRADRLMAVSPGVAGWLAEQGVERERIEVQANGVDPARFDGVVERRHARPDGAPFTIGFVGTFKPWHGLRTLIDGWARMREQGIDARLLLVGDGPERAGIERDLRERGLGNRVEWTGAVAPERIPAILARMDIAVAPYPASERFYFSPLKLYEYMAASLPVVCSRVGHLAEVVRDGVDGVLVPAGDAAALGAALTDLANDRSGRLRMGASGRERVLRAHTWDAVAARILGCAGGEVRAHRDEAGR
ncbi:MAG: glycosyltransferase family 4 protein [Burkholderiaceae bacterium]